MSSEMYFNNQKVFSGITNYNELSNASKPQINSIVLEGNRTAGELNLMTKTEIQQLVAQSKTTEVLANYPASPKEGVLYYIGSSAPYNVCLYAKNDQDVLTRVNLGTTNVDISSKQDVIDNNLTTTSKNIVGAINENKANVDLKQNITDDTLLTTNKTIPTAINEIVTDINALSNIYAPLQYYQLTQKSINANNCVFDINLTGAPSKNCISRKVYQNVVMTNPVTNAYAYGSMEVIEECSAGWNTITQIFTAFHSGSNVRETSMVFKRIGILQDDAQDRQVYTNRANIVWKNWFVIEYPRNTLNALPDNTQFTLNNNTFSITGGLLTINIRDLKSNVDVSRVSGVNFSKIPNLHRQEAYAFGTLYPLDNNTTETGGLQFQYDYVQAFGLKANVRYIGTLTIPLGY